MKYYFYIKNNKKQGPFSIEDLKEERINHSTLVWTEGLSDWTKASDLNDVKDIIVSEPPPIPKPLDTREYEAVYASCFIMTFVVFLSISKLILAEPIFPIILVIINIICTVWVYNIAKRLNRNALGWSIFAFLLLPIALIIIGFLRKKARDNE